MNMQELLQKRAKAIKAQEEIVDKTSGGLTDEMEKDFRILQQEISECDRQIKMLEQVDENTKKNYGGSVLKMVARLYILIRSRMGLKITAALKVWVKCCTLLNMAIKKAAWKILKHKILLMAQAVVI